MFIEHVACKKYFSISMIFFTGVCYHNHRSVITEPPSGTTIYKDSWDFDLYVDELNASVSAEIFKYNSWIQYYYNWAGVKDYNLVIRVNHKLHNRTAGGFHT